MFLRRRARLTAIGEVSEQIDALATSLRRVAADLRPPVLDDLGFVAALTWMTEGFERRFGVHTRCEVRTQELRLNDLAAISLYRVVQEALTNVARHAQANEVTVKLSVDNRDCHLRIHDDGVGFALDSPPRADAFGVLGMRERIVMLGGILRIKSTPGNGVSVMAHVPLSRILAQPNYC